MTANGLAIPCTVGRPRYPVRFGGRSAERSLLESRRVVSCLVTVPGSARAPHWSRNRQGQQARRAVDGASSTRGRQSQHTNVEILTEAR